MHALKRFSATALASAGIQAAILGVDLAFNGIAKKLSALGSPPPRTYTRHCLQAGRDASLSTLICAVEPQSRLPSLNFIRERMLSGAREPEGSFVLFRHLGTPHASPTALQRRPGRRPALPLRAGRGPRSS